MNASCARCNKTVYPVEKVNCLDKAWHKGCFNCEVCHITLTLKTYVALDKRPYCKAHYPEIKATAVADTPENRRIAGNTKLQSQVQYHAEFERSKADFTVVADTPEIARSVQNSRMQSQATYHQTNYGSEGAPQAGGYDAPAQASYGGGYDAPAQSSYGGGYDEPAQSYEEPAAAPAASGGAQFRALYDYAPDADDELTFQVGDIIVDAVQVGEGWLQGTNSRTGQTGLLPEPYVQAM